jgi:uncharacterized membrane protein YphA (DoxX/SURF4 family)
VFIFSGFVKGVDPLGSTYKFVDYFNAFGTSWANQLAFVLAIVLALAEFGVGVALVLNYRMKIFSWLATIFMAVFLPLTFWIAIKNPVTDCGCFGDALVISNWETFYKNIVLTALAIVVLVFRNQYNNKFNFLLQNGVFASILGLFLFMEFYCYNHLPIIDFRPYKIGNNINEGMKVPPGSPVDEYKNEFIYKNITTGEEKNFDETNYPWQDTLNWKFVSMKSILVKEGYHPPIHDFTMENSNGDNVADYFLLDPGYTFMLVAYRLDKTSTKTQQKINEFAAKALSKNINFICLTSSSREEIDAFKQEYQAPYEFFLCDEITLKTIIRSNPGLVLLKEGTVLDMWHWRDIPSLDEALKNKK